MTLSLITLLNESHFIHLNTIPISFQFSKCNLILWQVFYTQLMSHRIIWIHINLPSIEGPTCQNSIRSVFHLNKAKSWRISCDPGICYDSKRKEHCSHLIRFVRLPKSSDVYLAVQFPSVWVACCSGVCSKPRLGHNDMILYSQPLKHFFNKVPGK